MSADIPWRVAAIAWIVSGAIKACMVAAYRSTDFEVHRNWLAITSSLPLAQWYYEDTSEWTLDYPPLFAWFERVLGLAAPLFDTQMLRISAAPYASDATILFQRLSVIVTEAALLLALYTYLPSRRDSSKSSNPGPGIAIMLALNAGLFITDHVHFQYNGLLLGMLLTSAAMVNNDQHLGAALLFATVLNMKHLFLALGPAYFVYLLRFHCLEPAATCWNPRRSASGALSRFCVLGAAVLAVFCVAWGPFVAAGGLAGVQQILKRLFPFGRGLCHAYWAPNVWVVYNLADKVLVKALGTRGIAATGGASMTGGLVAEAKHVWLPRISPLTCALLSLAAMCPVLLHVWTCAAPKSCSGSATRPTASPGAPSERALDRNRPAGSGDTRPCMIHLIAVCSLGAFLFGYHVHEKALLHAAVPMLMLAHRSPRHAQAYRFLANVTHCQLLPLLFRRQEWVLKMLVWWAHASLVAIVFPCSRDDKLASGAGSLGRQGVREGSLRALVARLLAAYEWGLVLLPEVVEVLQRMWLPGLPFLPLLFRSSYCLPGVFYSFGVITHLFIRSGAHVKVD